MSNSQLNNVKSHFELNLDEVEFVDNHVPEAQAKNILKHNTIEQELKVYVGKFNHIFFIRQQISNKNQSSGHQSNLEHCKANNADQSIFEHI